MSYRVVNTRNTMGTTSSTLTTTAGGIASAINPLVGLVSGIFGGGTSARQAKIASDVAAARAGSVGDQQYVIYQARVGDVTRYEYDNLVRPLASSRETHAGVEALRASGLFTEDYIQNAFAWPPGTFASTGVQTQIASSPGSSAMNPAGGGGGGGFSMPNWILPVVGLGAVALLALTMFKKRRG